MSWRGLLVALCVLGLIYAVASGCLARTFEEGNRRPDRLSPVGAWLVEVK